jgi:HEAT repeat protein
VIGGLGESAKPAVPDLIALLRQRSMAGTVAALMAFEHLGPIAVDAVPAVIEVLNENRDPPIRISCVKFLAKVGTAAAPAVPSFIAILKGDDLVLKGWACEVLGNCPKEATKALPELIKASDTDTTFVGIEIFAPPEMREQIKQQENLVYWATRALAKLEPPAPTAGPTLTARLSSRGTATRSWAAYGLGRMESKAAPYLPALRKARETESDPDTRKTMDAAIAKISKE